VTLIISSTREGEVMADAYSADMGICQTLELGTIIL
jgi:hypothetical protein